MSKKEPEQSVVINEQLKLTTTYLQQLQQKVQNAYDLWNTLNKQSALQSEITAQKTQTVNSKIEIQQQIIQKVKDAYNEMCAVYGENSAQSVKLENQLGKEYLAYEKLIIQKNGISQSRQQELEETRQIIQAYNDFITKYEKIYDGLGVAKQEFYDIAAKATGYDKVKNKKVFEAFKTDEESVSEIKQQADIATQAFYDELNKNFSEIPENFFKSGENSAFSFSQGFIQGIKNMASEMQAAVTEVTSSIAEGAAKSAQSTITNYSSTYNINSGSSSGIESDIFACEKLESVKRARGIE